MRSRTQSTRQPDALAIDRVARADGDRGAVIALTAMAMVGLLIITAIVVDLGYVRAQKRETQKEVDIAALSAGQQLALLDGANIEQACLEALTYLRHNIGDLPEDAAVPCGDLPSTCDDSTAKVTVDDGATADPYVIEISYPIPDSDILDDTVPGGLRSEDGLPCERMGITLSRTSKGYFTSILGVDELTVLADVVVRRAPVEESRVPNLWLLEPFGCDVLKVSGGSSLTVGTSTDSGLITVDSTGDGNTCTNANDFVIDADGAGSSILAQPDNLVPPGEISLVSFFEDQDACYDPPDGNDNACEQGDYSGGQLYPMPTRRPSRATRAIVDHVYNCKEDYPDYSGDGGSIPIFDCGDVSRPAYIDLLSEYAGGPGDAVPSGFTTYSGACTVNSGVVNVPGNVYVGCNTLRIQNDGIVNFTGGNVILENGIVLQGAGKVAFNGTVDTAGVITSTNPTDDLSGTCDNPAATFVASACFSSSSEDAAWVYQRGKGITGAGTSQLVSNHAAIIQDPTGTTNYLSSSGTASWTSPDEGPLMGLSLWSEFTSSSYGLGGGGGLSLEGVFFTPEANPFTLNGGSSLEPQMAQFISRRLTITGGANLDLAPSGLKLIRLMPPAAFLIR